MVDNRRQSPTAYQSGRGVFDVQNSPYRQKKRQLEKIYGSQQHSVSTDSRASSRIKGVPAAPVYDARDDLNNGGDVEAILAAEDVALSIEERGFNLRSSSFYSVDPYANMKDDRYNIIRKNSSASWGIMDSNHNRNNAASPGSSLRQFTQPAHQHFSPTSLIPQAAARQLKQNQQAGPATTQYISQTSRASLLSAQPTSNKLKVDPILASRGIIDKDPSRDFDDIKAKPSSDFDEDSYTSYSDGSSTGIESSMVSEITDQSAMRGHNNLGIFQCGAYPDTLSAVDEREEFDQFEETDVKDSLPPSFSGQVKRQGSNVSSNSMRSALRRSIVHGSPLDVKVKDNNDKTATEMKKSMAYGASAALAADEAAAVVTSASRSKIKAEQEPSSIKMGDDAHSRHVPRSMLSSTYGKSASLSRTTLSSSVDNNKDTPGRSISRQHSLTRQRPLSRGKKEVVPTLPEDRRRMASREHEKSTKRTVSKGPQKSKIKNSPRKNDVKQSFARNDVEHSKKKQKASQPSSKSGDPSKSDVKSLKEPVKDFKYQNKSATRNFSRVKNAISTPDHTKIKPRAIQPSSALSNSDVETLKEPVKDFKNQNKSATQNFSHVKNAISTPEGGASTKFNKSRADAGSGHGREKTERPFSMTKLTAPKSKRLSLFQRREPAPKGQGRVSQYAVDPSVCRAYNGPEQADTKKKSASPSSFDDTNLLACAKDLGVSQTPFTSLIDETTTVASDVTGNFNVKVAMESDTSKKYLRSILTPGTKPKGRPKPLQSGLNQRGRFRRKKREKETERPFRGPSEPTISEETLLAAKNKSPVRIKSGLATEPGSDQKLTSKRENIPFDETPISDGCKERPDPCHAMTTANTGMRDDPALGCGLGSFSHQDRQETTLSETSAAVLQPKNLVKKEKPRGRFGWFPKPISRKENETNAQQQPELHTSAQPAVVENAEEEQRDNGDQKICSLTGCTAMFSILETAMCFETKSREKVIESDQPDCRSTVAEKQAPSTLSQAAPRAFFLSTTRDDPGNVDELDRADDGLNLVRSEYEEVARKPVPAKRGLVQRFFRRDEGESKANSSVLIGTPNPLKESAEVEGCKSGGDVTKDFDADQSNDHDDDDNSVWDSESEHIYGSDHDNADSNSDDRISNQKSGKQALEVGDDEKLSPSMKNTALADGPLKRRRQFTFWRSRGKGDMSPTNPSVEPSARSTPSHPTSKGTDEEPAHINLESVEILSPEFRTGNHQRELGNKKRGFIFWNSRRKSRKSVGHVEVESHVEKRKIEDLNEDIQLASPSELEVAAAVEKRSDCFAGSFLCGMGVGLASWPWCSTTTEEEIKIEKEEQVENNSTVNAQQTEPLKQSEGRAAGTITSVDDISLSVPRKLEGANHDICENIPSSKSPQVFWNCNPNDGCASEEATDDAPLIQEQDHPVANSKNEPKKEDIRPERDLTANNEEGHKDDDCEWSLPLCGIFLCIKSPKSDEEQEQGNTNKPGVEKLELTEPSTNPSGNGGSIVHSDRNDKDRITEDDVLEKSPPGSTCCIWPVKKGNTELNEDVSKIEVKETSINLLAERQQTEPAEKENNELSKVSLGSNIRLEHVEQDSKQAKESEAKDNSMTSPCFSLCWPGTKEEHEAMVCEDKASDIPNIDAEGARVDLQADLSDADESTLQLANNGTQPMSWMACTGLQCGGNSRDTAISHSRTMETEYTGQTEQTEQTSSFSDGDDEDERTVHSDIFSFLKRLIRGNEDEDELRDTLQAVQTLSNLSDADMELAFSPTDEDDMPSVSDETYRNIKEAVRTVKRHASRVGVSEKEFVYAMADEGEDFWETALDHVEAGMNRIGSTKSKRTRR